MDSEDWLSLLSECAGFDWDDGNSDKNFPSHRVTDVECEQVFFNDPLVVRSDVGHSAKEKRFFALGSTDAGRPLVVAFAVRRKLIRVTSARDMTRKELRYYLR